MTRATHDTSPRGPRRRARRASRRGVTLVEVLATVVLVAIVLPVAMQALSVTLAAVGAARERSEAAGLAESKLAELVATGDWQYGGGFGGEFPGWPGYRWSAEVAQWNVATVQELTLRVTWQHRGEPREVRLATLVYQPPAATGGAT